MSLRTRHITVTTSADTPEIQTVALTDGPTGGTFTITFSGQTTTALARNASGSDVQTALEVLSNIAPGDVTVVRTGAGTQASPFVYTLTFAGAYLDTNVAEVTASGANLTGSTVTVATTVQGSGGADEIQTVELTDGPTSGTFTITFGAGTTTPLAFNASGAAVKTALDALASVSTVSVVRSGAGTQASPYLYTVTFDGAETHTNVASMTASGALLRNATVTILTTQQGNAAGNATGQGHIGTYPAYFVGIAVAYTDQPATCDVVVTCDAGFGGPQTLYTLSNANVDVPLEAVTNNDIMSGTVYVTVTGGDDDGQVDVILVLDDRG